MIEKLKDLIRGKRRAKIGDVVSIDTIDFRNRLFTIDEISVYSRSIDGHELPFTEYRVSSSELASPVYIRFDENPWIGDGVECGESVVITEVVDSFGWDKSFIDVVSDASVGGPFVTEDGEFFRPEGVTKPYSCDVTKTTANSSEDSSLFLWDFYSDDRTCFVEQDGDNGWIEVKVGSIVDSDLVNIN